MKEIYKDVMWFLCAFPILFLWFWGKVFHSQRLIDKGDRLKMWQEEKFL